MFSEEETSFEKILQRLKGVYMTLYIMPNDDIDGVLQSVEENGKISLTREIIPLSKSTVEIEANIISLNIQNVKSVCIRNDEIADGSPLSIALKKAQNQ
jgi:hypothetical protein